MTTNSRKAIESPLEHGTTMVRAYILDSALVSSPAVAPTNPTNILYDETHNDRDVSATLLTGTIAVDGTDITTQAVRNLTKDIIYRLVVEWGPAGDRISVYWQLYGTL